MKNISLVKLLLIFILSCQCSITHAKEKLYVLDIYGTNKISHTEIEKRFNQELSIIAKTIRNHYGSNDEKQMDKMNKSMLSIGEHIMSTGKFSNINISPVIYQNTKTIYITLNVTEKNQEKRITHFLPEPTRSITEPYHLISSWNDYEKLGAHLTFYKKENTNFNRCPAHHCIYGFEHPALKKYEKIFSDAEKHKALLADILQYDKNHRKRATAAYLLAHIKDKQELVKLISPSINDANSDVRNNVMRVLMMVAMDDNKISLPIDDIIAAVNLPNTTDRNKSLYIVYGLAGNPKNAKVIKTKLASQLMDNLRLQQPNNHEPAYEILKRISGKNYGERDYQAWENWLKQN